MRILGVSEGWPKLEKPEFTTFRFARKDRDWQVGEMVQVVYRPRSKDREVLGTARIMGKEARCMAWRGSELTEPKVTEEEAETDGFGPPGKEAYFAMWRWLWGVYGGRRVVDEPMNKLVLHWEANR